MGLRLKKDVDPEVLRQYGFKLGKEFADAGEPCLEGIGYEYQHNWWHKFLMDEEEPDKIYYSEGDVPAVQITFRVGDNCQGDLYVDLAPEGTYHIGGSELDVLHETLYDLISAGILEKY